MILYPRQIRCIQICQNGTDSDYPGTVQPYKSFFIAKTDAVKCKQNRIGGGDFEITLPYNQRNVDLFSKIETIPTFILISFYTENPWKISSINSIPHPMPMVVETYGEAHDLLERKHTITISGRGVLDVVLSNKVVMPKTTYQNPSNIDNPYDPELSYAPWDIAVDLFGRNVNGDKTPTDKFIDIGSTMPSYLLSTDNPLDVRFIPDISLTSDVEYKTGEPRIERSYDGDSLAEAITGLIAINNLCITGRITIDEIGHMHFDYIIQRLTDLRLSEDVTNPLVYDYGSMPPRSYQKLLSNQEERDVVYIKRPPLTGETVSDYVTVTRGTEADNKKYFGWVMKETTFDGSSLPMGELNEAKYLAMLEMAAADELYKDGNTLVKVEDIEYLYSPMRYYQNCWPGCIYTSIGPDGEKTSLIIESLVLTGSDVEGWVITPELSHYVDPYEPT
jgi:hypothetical protein